MSAAHTPSRAGRRIRVVLADDSSFVRRAFLRVLAPASDLEVVGEAADGAEALELCQRLLPDVLVLDLHMPVRDGLSTLDAMRRLQLPTRVVVASTSTQRGAEVTLTALEKGAFDFLDKESVGSRMRVHELGDVLLEKIRCAGLRPGSHATPPRADRLDFVPQRPEVLVVGASTGGPVALAALLAGLPPQFEAPVVIVQHIPAAFAEPLGSRLARASARPARVAQAGQLLEPGQLYLAAGTHECELYRREGALAVVFRRAAAGTPHVPSVDALFHSAARVCGARAWGALLTGMGRDGAAGLLQLRRAGGLTLAQDEASSAVWGMPGTACELGAAHAVLPIHALGPFIGEVLRTVVPADPAVGPTEKESPCEPRFSRSSF